MGVELVGSAAAGEDMAVPGGEGCGSGALELAADPSNLPAKQVVSNGTSWFPVGLRPRM